VAAALPEHISHAELLQLLDESSSEETSAESSEHSDYEPASKHINTAPVNTSQAGAPKVTKAPVEKVKHTKGYNYGVPTSAHGAGAKPKQKPGSYRTPGDEKIKVCVRKRPLSKKERRTDKDIITADSTTTIKLLEPKFAVDLTAYTLQVNYLNIHVELLYYCVSDISWHSQNV
jgi:hypothetical protein